jgi:hypothetical protein
MITDTTLFRRMISATFKPRVRFEDLPIGAAFRLQTPAGYIGGVHYKTGPLSYGLHADEAIWGWFDPKRLVEPVAQEKVTQ